MNYSYVNAAISSRLEAHPQRIFWSGLQTYSDITEVVKDIKKGKIKGISPEADLDLFGYSIGSFLAFNYQNGRSSTLFYPIKSVLLLWRNDYRQDVSYIQIHHGYSGNS